MAHISVVPNTSTTLKKYDVRKTGTEKLTPYKALKISIKPKDVTDANIVSAEKILMSFNIFLK